MAAKGHVTIFLLLVQIKFYILAVICESFTVIGCMVLEILSVGPIYPHYTGVRETCLALRYWFFEVLGSESVKYHTHFNWSMKNNLTYFLRAIN